MAFGVALGGAYGVALGVALGVAFGVATILGALRAPFYVIELVLSLLGGRALSQHPAIQDELAVLPFPGLARRVTEALATEWDVGLRATRALLRNPFQRRAVGRAFVARWQEAAPLPDLYRVLQVPQMAAYAVIPLSEKQMANVCSSSAVWLGEVSRTFVDVLGDDDFSERLVWWFTHLRAKPHPQAAPLARFLLHLELNDLADEGVDEELLTEAVAAIRPLAHSGEIVGSLMALKNMAQAEKIESIALSRASPLPMMSPALRPRVMEALRGLVDVATEVHRFRQASSPAVQAQALNRAIGMLEELEGYVGEILVPERRLLALIIERWQSLAAEAAGRLGARALREMAPSERRALGLGEQERRATFWSRPAEPFPNPYKTGDPVMPPLFVGRGDIFNRIREVWTGKANPDSIILYGHRRMGKSSILRNLGEYAPPGSLLVYVDLKGEAAFAKGTHHLLLGLAEAVAWAAQDAGHDLPNPAPAAYDTPAEAAQAFKRLLRRAVHALPAAGSLILALDEFEAVDAAVRAGKIGREIYDYLRMLSQRPRLVVVFAGLHTLDEMSRDYQEAFFDSYINLPVSYLPPEAAERLIARPTPDFRLDYHADVIAEIIAQTHGQPLLVQRLCQELVNHLNHELFDLEIEREARLLPDDLAAVLDDAFVRSETRYFEGIWHDQIANKDNPAVMAVLDALAAGPATVAALAAAASLSDEEVIAALDYLETRDLVGRAGQRWDLRVPLMRRWLRLRGED